MKNPNISRLLADVAIVDYWERLKAEGRTHAQEVNRRYNEHFGVPAGSPRAAGAGQTGKTITVRASTEAPEQRTGDEPV